MTYAYAGIMICAMGVSAMLARRTQRGLRLEGYERFGVACGAFCGAMIGAKLPFVLSDGEGFLSGAAWFSSGKTILCGLVGGYLGVEVAKWALEIRAKTGDSFAVPVAVAVAIGRLACFRAGCCYGTPTDGAWGVVFPAVDALPRHPTQLYEFGFHLVAAAFLAYCLKRQWFAGQLIKIYILAYCGYRVLSETIRPEARLWYGLTGYQLAAVCIAALFVWLIWRDARSGVRPRAAVS